MPELLPRFLRLEVARLTAIPLTFTDWRLDKPVLNIRRVEKVVITEEINQSQVAVSTRLMLERNTVWEGTFRVHIRGEYED